MFLVRQMKTAHFPEIVIETRVPRSGPRYGILIDAVLSCTNESTTAMGGVPKNLKDGICFTGSRKVSPKYSGATRA